MFFSIIIPTYNRASLLLNTLDSIKFQNFHDYEVVIVDDFSTDDTIKSLDVYVLNNQNLNLKILKHDINLGTNIARNNGSKISSGRYFIFLDSDDQFYTSNSLTNIYQEIVKENFPKIMMFSSFYKKENKVVSFRFSCLDFSGFLKNKNNGEFLPVVDSRMFDRILFPVGIRGGEGITWLSITKLTNKICYSSVVVRLYNNVDDNRLSSFSLVYFKRLSSVFQLYLKIFWLDLLLKHPTGLLNIVMRILYYKLGSYSMFYSLFVKYKNN